MFYDRLFSFYFVLIIFKVISLIIKKREKIRIGRNWFFIIKRGLVVWVIYVVRFGDKNFLCNLGEDICFIFDIWNFTFFFYYFDVFIWKGIWVN